MISSSAEVLRRRVLGLIVRLSLAVAAGLALGCPPARAAGGGSGRPAPAQE